jgi:putative PIN family toxin of toxin-antitoxin system
MKIVADTNVLVSARIVPIGKPAAIFHQIGLFEHVTSPEILAETESVLHRRHIQRRYKLTNEDVADFIRYLRDVSTIIEPVAEVSGVSVDPDDDKFLSLAIEAGADYVVSGDPHLTDLGGYAGITIVTPARFLDLLSAATRQETS